MMAEEEKAKAEEGLIAMHDVSAGAFLLLGTEIQCLQYVSHYCYLVTTFNFCHRQNLHLEVGGLRKQTLLQTMSLVERWTVLVKCVQRFREIQRTYMPGFDHRNYASTELTNTSDSASANIEHTKLYLPSELSAADRHRFCPNGLSAMEDRIRFAEASDSLEDLRHHLHTRSFTNRFKIANVTEQIKNTCAREVQHHIDDKVRAAELQY